MKYTKPWNAIPVTCARGKLCNWLMAGTRLVFRIGLGLLLVLASPFLICLSGLYIIGGGVVEIYKDVRDSS